MTDRTLDKVERAAARERRARLELELAMRDASQAGHSLRPIAHAAGRSPEWTRQAIRRATPAEATS